jgi:hypothetical protein
MLAGKMSEEIVPRDTPATRILRRAAETLGSEQALANAVEAPIETVAKWLSGDMTPSNGAFLIALDIVARGPFRPSRAR